MPHHARCTEYRYYKNGRSAGDLEISQFVPNVLVG